MQIRRQRWRPARLRLDTVQAFDWHRMFFGDTAGLLYLLEIVFRSLVMYMAALVFAHVIGKRATGQVTSFELILIIIIGSAAGDPMYMPEVPLIHGIVVLGAIMVIHRLIGFAINRSETIERLMEGRPQLIIEDGRLNEKQLGGGTMSKQEVMMRLRQQGISDTGEVELAYMEPSGQISVLRAPPERKRQVESTLPRDST